MRHLLTILLVLLAVHLQAAEPLSYQTWQVEGVTREALVYVPKTAHFKPSPLIFAFHGHGGSMQNAASMYHYHELWPEAMVVYMQGLNTPGKLTDPDGKKPGWQGTLGAQNDRDLKFFDAVLATAKDTCKVDARRIYSTGHSNGGGFTYLLWAARGDVFAAMAPSSAFAIKPLFDKFKPKPVLHVAGEADPLVKFAWQKATMDQLRTLNGCAEEGRPWEKYGTLYESKTGTPVVTLIHPGTHTFLKEAPAIIVKFFKEHPAT
ncbi:MAG: esterase [Verrucomicrobiaceae bacterium]|nr:esterase [Verrucomicrobiaceae bacterium]